MSGFPAIRVSSAKKGDTAKMRQAVAAIREATNWVAGGGALVVTPDGPRGPNEIIAPGALQIAKRSGQPVFLMGIAASPAAYREGALVLVPVAARPRAGGPAPLPHGCAIHDHSLDSLRRLDGPREARRLVHRARIEDREIREGAFAQDAAAFQPLKQNDFHLCVSYFTA